MTHTVTTASFFAEWETEDDNPLRFKHTPGLYGCPPEIPIVRDTIQSTVIAFEQNPKRWFHVAITELRKRASFKSFAAKRAQAASFAGLLEKWSKRKKQRYFINEERAGAKLNRFGHAMDPDRGIITLISCLLSNSHKIYGEYALVREQHVVFKQPYVGLDELRQRLKATLDFDRVPGWFKEMLLRGAEQLTTQTDTFSIQHEWLRHGNEAWSRVITTLAYFTDGIYLGKNGPLLTWDRDELLGGSVRTDFHDLIKEKLGFGQKSSITPVELISREVDEDEVTYALVHRVLQPNGFQIIAISYPGAQGGSPILPETGAGRRQKRVYPDVIALPPAARVDFDALLNESKGMFEQASVLADVGKLQRYQTSDEHREALKTMLVKAKVMNENHELREIVIGVAFGVNTPTDTTWRVDLIDFIFRIVARSRWALATFRQDLRDLIPIMAGDTDYPQCYKVVQSAAPKASRKPPKQQDSVLFE